MAYLSERKALKKKEQPRNTHTQLHTHTNTHTHKLMLITALLLEITPKK